MRGLKYTPEKTRGLKLLLKKKSASLFEYKADQEKSYRLQAMSGCINDLMFLDLEIQRGQVYLEILI